MYLLFQKVHEQKVESHALFLILEVFIMFAQYLRNNTLGDSQWLSTSPIYVADSRASGKFAFPTRKLLLRLFQKIL